MKTIVNNYKRNVTSPVFWGSFFGILSGSIIGGLSYLGQIGNISHIVASKPRVLVVVFCCLLCVRYYASIIFLTYDDATSPRIAQFEHKARRAVYIIQLLLIIGCSLNIAFLPVFGGAAATAIIVLQATLIIEYWRRLWRVLLTAGSEGKFRIVIVIRDLTILFSAIAFFCWENGWLKYDDTGAGMCMGAIIFIFIVECATTYYNSIRKFLGDTIDALS